MQHVFFKKRSTQIAVSVGAVLAVCGISMLISDWIGYQTVALLLFVSVSVLALFFEFIAVSIAATLSALLWNFLFIEPRFTFKITNTADLRIFLLYFVVAFLHAVLSYKKQQAEKQARIKEDQERSLALYNTILHALSHELRTPIASIQSAAETLASLKRSENVSIEIELITEIQHANSRLNDQVRNLLNMSRIENQMLRPKFNWWDIQDILRELKDQFPQSQWRRVHVKMQEPFPLLETDGGFLKEMLQNGIKNALQYSAETEPVILSIELNSESTECCMRIIDRGMGLDPEYMESYFEKFQRGKQHSVEGLGLGLSLIKGYCAALNGKVQLLNIKEGGACLEIVIPMKTSYLNQMHYE